MKEEVTALAASCQIHHAVASANVGDDNEARIIVGDEEQNSK